MPDPFERHGRLRNGEWGSAPSRSQARAAAASDDPVRKNGKNKITPKKECTASPNGMHRGEAIRTTDYSQRKNAPLLTCEWIPCWYRRKDDDVLAWWNCRHTEFCVHCGNKMRHGMDTQCPDYPGSPEQKATAEQQTLDREEDRAYAQMSAWKRRKVPNGPQSYRKRKSGK